MPTLEERMEAIALQLQKVLQDNLRLEREAVSAPHTVRLKNPSPPPAKSKPITGEWRALTKMQNLENALKAARLRQQRLQMWQ